jgi:hydrogenase maturation protein HypF
LLTAPQRPIVLLKKNADTDAALEGVAPGLAWLGAMLPYTPLHYLLFHQARGRPQGLHWLDEPQPLVLVMTSANPGGEPLVAANDEALQRLGGIADAFLIHDRASCARPRHARRSLFGARADTRRPQSSSRPPGRRSSPSAAISRIRFA